jgi:adenosylcobinamide-GDP ribazoletransferase
MQAFFSAIRFLTILSVPGDPVEPGRAAAYFPLVGAIIGAAGAGVFLLAGLVLPLSLAALATVAFWTAVSGVLHEDGLADVADAVRAGRKQAQILTILKDSRIGTFGAVALILSVIARWQALQSLALGSLATDRIVEALVASQAVPRAAMVAMAWTSRPTGDGLGHAFLSTLSTPAALNAMAQGAVAALICGWRPGIAMVVGSFLIVRLARAWFYRRIGGVNGDCLGFTEQLLEVYVLVLFTCARCAW